MNRKAFFDAIRDDPFPGHLTSAQVSGMDAILTEWDRRRLTDLRWLAYMLATTFHETARTMQPINEFGSNRYFNERYGPTTKVGRTLGNTEVGDGAKFHGRGYVQLTGRANYRKATEKLGVNFAGNPALALEPDHAAAIMFLGMSEGWFTTRKLSDYFHDTKTDWKNARRIVNGLDRASEIAGYAQAFHKALEEASRQPDDPGVSNDPHDGWTKPPDLQFEWEAFVFLVVVAAAALAAFFMFT